MYYQYNTETLLSVCQTLLLYKTVANYTELDDIQEISGEHNAWSRSRIWWGKSQC